MKYVIQSERLGKIGDSFEPAEGVNIEALIEGGFIAVEESTDISKKPSTIKKTPKE
jgi:hypothetical protein